MYCGDMTMHESCIGAKASRGQEMGQHMHRDVRRQQKPQGCRSSWLAERPRA